MRIEWWPDHFKMLCKYLNSSLSFQNNNFRLCMEHTCTQNTQSVLLHLHLAPETWPRARAENNAKERMYMCISEHVTRRYEGIIC